MSSTSRSAPIPCPIDVDVSTVFVPSWEHWRATLELVFGRRSARLAVPVLERPASLWASDDHDVAGVR